MRLPTSVIVFAALNILFGALGLCGTILNVVIAFVPIAGDDPMSRVVRDHPGTQIYFYVSYAVTFVASAWLLASGIGLLLRQNWARAGSVAYGWFAIAQTIATQGLNYLLVLRPLMAEMEKSPLQPAERMGMLGGIVGVTACGGVVGLAYSALLIYFMTREHVRRAFGAAAGAVDGGHWPPRPETGNPYQSPG